MATVDELMRSNLLAVFGERDPGRRAAAAARTYAPDVVFRDPEGAVTGRDALVAKAGALLDGAPGFGFAPRGPVLAGATEVGVLGWRFGPPDGDPVATGTDIAIVEDGLITRLYTVLETPAPWADGAAPVPLPPG